MRIHSFIHEKKPNAMNLFTLISVVLLITLFSVNVIAARESFTPPKTEEIIENNVTPTISLAEEKSDIHYLMLSPAICRSGITSISTFTK